MENADDTAKLPNLLRYRALLVHSISPMMIRQEIVVRVLARLERVQDRATFASMLPGAETHDQLLTLALHSLNAAHRDCFRP